MRLKSFDEYLYRELQDREFATAYLEDAISDSLDEFLVALQKSGLLAVGTFLSGPNSRVFSAHTASGHSPRACL